MAISEVGNHVSAGTSAAASDTHGLSILTGDVVVVMLHSDGNATQTDNNGATPLTSPYGVETPAAGSTTSIWVRVAGASEPAAYAWTISASVSWSVITRVFRGVHADIWDVAPAAARTAVGTSTAPLGPDMTITNAGAMGVVAIFADMSTSVGWISGIGNSYGTEAISSNSRNQACYIRAELAAGAVGTTGATLSPSDDWAAYQFALKPAAAGNPHYAYAQQ